MCADVNVKEWLLGVRGSWERERKKGVEKGRGWRGKNEVEK